MPMDEESHGHIRVLCKTCGLINIGENDPDLVTLIHADEPRGITIAETTDMDLFDTISGHSYAWFLSIPRYILIGIMVSWIQGIMSFGLFPCSTGIRKILAEELFTLPCLPPVNDGTEEDLGVVRLPIHRDDLQGLTIRAARLICIHHLMVHRIDNAGRAEQPCGELIQGEDEFVIYRYGNVPYPIVDRELVHHLLLLDINLCD